ncbi:UNVERIFIED_CONTAM: hypothetical protein FKN15_045607 [Acipenser sinensis]
MNIFALVADDSTLSPHLTEFKDIGCSKSASNCLLHRSVGADNTAIAKQFVKLKNEIDSNGTCSIDNWQAKNSPWFFS